MAEGYGACLIKKPELLRDIVRQTKARVNNSDFTVSVKIRIHDDIRYCTWYALRKHARVVYRFFLSCKNCKFSAENV